jgi:hypothetical protein
MADGTTFMIKRQITVRAVVTPLERGCRAGTQQCHQQL